MSDETKALETIKENGLVLGSKKDNSIFGQFEKLLDSIIEAKVQEAIEAMHLVDENRVRDVLSDEIRNELDAQEVPDVYGVKEIVQEEIDNIDWNDRVSESGALDGIVTEDTLESTLDEHRDGGEYVLSLIHI